MDLDEAFVSKDEVGQAVLDQLREVMKDYGYEINKTLVTDLAPDNRVKASMNEINARLVVLFLLCRFAFVIFWYLLSTFLLKIDLSFHVPFLKSKF